MKLISKLQGFSTLRVSPDEAMPPGGIVFHGVISALKEAYKFTVYPELSPGDVPLVQVAPIGLGFQNGELDVGGTKAAVSQLQLFLNGIAVGAQSTDYSDAILADVITLLDERFGFRFGQSKSQKSHISNLVVEFDKPFEDTIPKLKIIQDIIFASAQPDEEDGKKTPLATKRLAFGSRSRATINPLLANQMDFVIERRGGTAFSTNRYFSGAPLESDEHIRVLEAIERALLS